MQTSESREIIMIDTTIKNYQNFYYKLGQLKNNEGTGIGLKPKYSEINEVYSDSSSGEIIYKYKALKNYSGKDFVELYRERSQGNNEINIVDTIKIHFTIEDGL
jgi:hypothetical protein